MCAKSSDNRSQAFQSVVEALDSASSILLLTHVSPDGDAIGSLVALSTAAIAARKKADILLFDPLPRRYEFLIGENEPADMSGFDALAEAADVILIADTCTFNQLGDAASGVASRKDKVVVVDHHATFEDVGALQWNDTSAAATGVMAGELLDELNWPQSEVVATAIATAVVTDTGWLRFSNTDSRTLQVFARCIQAGVKPDELYRTIFQQDRPQRLKLMSRMLDSLETHADGKLAIMTLTVGDFERTGAGQDETEELINEAMRIGSVEAVVLLVERPEHVRASLRSRGLIDVAKIATNFGGGGHTRAAGCKSTGDLESFKAKLTETLIQTFSTL